MIFDALGHATVDGKWLDTDINAEFKTYSDQLKLNNFVGGIASGLSNRNGYDHKSFYEISSNFKNIYPIAGFNPLIEDEKELLLIKNIGYSGIKIHSRFSNIDLVKDKEQIIKCLKKCAEYELVVFFCSYFSANLSNYNNYDSFSKLVDIFSCTTDTKIVIVHGGVLDILKYSELTRFNPNLLLDLSLTIMKYEGSSIDYDLKFLFKNFDRRICIGSDFPEYNLDDVKKRFDFFSKNIDEEKRKNIASKNIMKFLNIV